MRHETLPAARTAFASAEAPARAGQPAAPLSPAVDADCPSPYPRLDQPRYRSLDAWRGLACLMVILLHASFSYKAADSPAERRAHPLAWAALAGIEKMSVGVPLFFVISGYCVSATIDSSRRRSHSTLDYFRRRVRRIFPPYWAALVATLLVYGIVLRLWPITGMPLGHWHDGAIPSLAGFSPSEWLGNGTLTEQWRGHLFGSAPATLLPPSWTLCYEEQFYAICGLLLLLMPVCFFRGTLIVSLLTAAVYGGTIAMPRLHVDGFFFDGRWLMFAAGVLVYYSLNYQSPRARWRSAAALALGFGVATVLYKRTSLGDADVGVRDIAYSLRISGGYALLLMALRPLDPRIASVRMLAPLAVCGRMCYSLYLIHWPVAKVLQSALYHAGVRGLVPTLTITLPLVMTASLLAGWGFHHLVERRFMNSHRPVNAC